MSGAQELKTYRGNCHCGAYTFEVKTSEIKTAISCNCSSCSKKAYLWLFLPEGSVTVVKDEGLLTEYICGPHKSTHRVGYTSSSARSTLQLRADKLVVLQSMRHFSLRHKPIIPSRHSSQRQSY